MVRRFRNTSYYLLALGQYPITPRIDYTPSHPAKDALGKQIITVGKQIITAG